MCAIVCDSSTSYRGLSVDLRREFRFSNSFFEARGRVKGHRRRNARPPEHTSNTSDGCVVRLSESSRRHNVWRRRLPADIADMPRLTSGGCMRTGLGRACLCALLIAVCGGAYAAGTDEAGHSASSAKASPTSRQADGRVSGQGSAGGMQPSTPGGSTGNTAGSARLPTQGSSGGRQPVTPVPPAGGANQDTSAGKSKPASE